MASLLSAIMLPDNSSDRGFIFKLSGEAISLGVITSPGVWRERGGGVTASGCPFPPFSRMLGALTLASQTPVPVVGMISALMGQTSSSQRGKSQNLNL